MRRLLPFLCFSLLLVQFSIGPLQVSGAAESKPSGDPAILPADSKLEELWNEGEFTEGVAVNSRGTVYFSDIAFKVDEPGRIMKFDPASRKVSVYCPDSGKSNGLFFDAEGRLIAACGANGGLRAIVEIKPDGTTARLYDKFNGKKFNSPNDLVIDSHGNIFFSDPRYVGPEPMELDQQSVYRITPEGKITRVTKTISKPNGVQLSPDEKTLYVAETNNGNFDVTKEVDPNNPPKLIMTLNAFVLNPDGTVGQQTQLVNFGQKTGTDGMTIDTEGNIYAAVRNEDRFGIVVFSPEGKERAYIPTPSLPTNCTFGFGEDAHSLYVTAGGGLYRITLKSTGAHPTLKTK